MSAPHPHPERLQPLHRITTPFYTNAKGELARDITAPLPESGTIILLSIPYALDGPESIHDSTIRSTSTGGFVYHPCIVHCAVPTEHGADLDIFLCRSFSAVSVTDAVEFIDNLSADEKKLYIPVAPTLSTDPILSCPPDFGQPLELMAGFRFRKPTWVMPVLMTVTLRAEGKVSCLGFDLLASICHRDPSVHQLTCIIVRAASSSCPSYSQ